MELGLKIQFAAEKLFNRFGVRSVSMDDVSKEINISKKTLYKCFRDKNELISTTVNIHIDRMETAIYEIKLCQSHAIKQLNDITKFAIEQSKSINPNMMFDLQKYHPEIYQVLVVRRESHSLVRIHENIELGRLQGFYRDDFDEKIIAKAFSKLTFTTFDSFDESLSIEDAKYTISEIMKYHIHGIATELGKEELEKINWN